MANILVVGPHPDDQEIGMGGTVLRLVAQGHRVLLLDMTNGEPTPHGDPETRAREMAEAARVLGVERKTLSLPNREVVHSLQARHMVAAEIRLFGAQIVFLPYPQDAHPDHLATTRIVEDARFDAKLSKTNLPGDPVYPKWLIYYYAMHLRRVVDPTLLIDVSDQYQTKEQAVLAYESQFVRPEQNRRHVQAMREMAGYLGSRIGVRYAEPFWLREPLGLGSLDGLVM